MKTYAWDWVLSRGDTIKEKFADLFQQVELISGIHGIPSVRSSKHYCLMFPTMFDVNDVELSYESGFKVHTPKMDWAEDQDCPVDEIRFGNDVVLKIFNDPTIDDVS